MTDEALDALINRLKLVANGAVAYKTWRGEAPAGEPTLRRDLFAFMAHYAEIASREAGPDREKMARIIEPDEWAEADRFAGKPKLTRGDFFPPADQWVCTQPSLSKADEIIRQGAFGAGLPSEPSDEILRAMLAVEYPATYRDHLHHPNDGPKSRERTKHLIEIERRRYAAILAAISDPRTRARDDAARGNGGAG